MIVCPAATGTEGTWRQATDAELASLLPARAPVEKEHIETEMRTASGIVNARGRLHCRGGAAYRRLLGRRQVLALPRGAGAGEDWWNPAQARRIRLRMGPRQSQVMRSGVRFHVAATGVLVGDSGSASHRRIDAAWKACTSGRRETRR